MDIEIGAFLSGPRNPEHEALLRLIGTFIYGRDGPKSGDQHTRENTGKEWSDAELTELGNMLVGRLSIEGNRATAASRSRRCPG